jgi:hypothetical protein
MALVQRLAVIRVQAETHLGATAFANFRKPIRIGQRLAGEPHDVRRAAAQRLFGLIKVMYAAGEHDGRGKPSLADFRADACTRIDIAAKGPFGVRIIRRHALITAAPGVRVRGLADFWLRGILKFSAARQ